MAKTLTKYPELGEKVRYLGTGDHPKAAENLVDGKVYEITQKEDGIVAMLFNDGEAFPAFKDESPEGFWALIPEEFEHFELVGSEDE